MVGVEPSALNGNRVGVHVRCDHLELSGTQGGQLGHQILIATAFLEQVTHFFDVLRLREAPDEGRVGLSEDLVVHVAHVLGRQYAGNPVFSGLFENQFDQVFGRWITRMRW